MLPYFNEYKEYLLTCNKENSVKAEINRLAKLNRTEKNLLEMSSDEIFQAIEADKKNKTTLYNTTGNIEKYLQWLNSVYNIPVYDCYYEVKTLKKNAQSFDNIRKKFFMNYDELLITLLKAEKDYLKQAEASGFSERKMDGIVIKQKMLNAYVIFLWNQIGNKEMLLLSLSDIAMAIETKQISLNGRIIPITDTQADILQDTLDTVRELHTDIENKIERSLIVYKHRLELKTYNNLFNTESIKVLNNLKWDALGSSVTDLRLQLPNITKAGIFSKLNKYEIENDYIFENKESVKLCSELLNISETIAQRYIVEYRCFKDYKYSAK